MDEFERPHRDEARRKLRATIAALKARTTGAGCTEAEALAAAEKIAELLSRHGIEDSADIDFEDVEIDCGSRRTLIDNLWPQVAIFCHCEFWWATGSRVAAVYFGRWNDVAAAEYLHQVLERHVRAATRAFHATPDYRRRRTAKTKRAATAAFQDGLVKALRDKLWTLQWRRLPQTEGSANHRALVLSPLSAVRDALKRRNIDFKTARPVSAPTDRRFESDRWSGRDAARGIHIHAPVDGAERPAPKLLAGGS